MRFELITTNNFKKFFESKGSDITFEFGKGTVEGQVFNRAYVRMYQDPKTEKLLLHVIGGESNPARNIDLGSIDMWLCYENPNMRGSVSFSSVSDRFKDSEFILFLNETE